MSVSINKVILIGNIGTKPEIKKLKESGKEMAIFTLATNEQWKKKESGETIKTTEWHKIIVFSKGILQVIKKYLRKGDKVYIEGKLRTREYKDKQGIIRFFTEIILVQYNCNLILLNNKKRDNHEESYSQHQEKDKNNKLLDENEIEEDIPF